MSVLTAYLNSVFHECHAKSEMDSESKNLGHSSTPRKDRESIRRGVYPFSIEFIKQIFTE